jgi:lipopolysaccharide export system permease protein
MKKLDTYLTFNVLKVFVITELAGLALSLVVDFFEHMDVLAASFRNFSLSLSYLFLMSPYYCNLILPLAFLISMLIVLILMIRGNEMITVRTSGISTVALMKPLLGLALFFVVISFLLSEWIIPMSSHAAEYIFRVKIKREEPYIFVKNDRIWFKKHNIINNIDFFDVKKDTIRGLTVIELSDTYAVVKRTDAKTGVWKNGAWIFSQVVERKFEKDGIASKTVIGTARNLIKEPPSAFKIVQKNPEDMGYKELSRYIRRLERNGYDARRYLVDLYNKIAFPFINLILVFAAFSVGLRYTKTKHIAKGILAGMSLGALYWIFHSIFLSLGYSEIFPPLFAAWLSNVLFLSAGVIGIVTLRT